MGSPFYQTLGQAEILGPGPCPFTTAVASKAPASTAMKIDGNRYLRVTVTPVFDASNTLTHLIALTRETTDETQQQLKVNAIHKAGDELADLTPEELAQMGVEERTDLLKYNIARHMKDLLGLDFIEIRLLDRATKRLVPLLTEGMTPLAANRELYARKEGNGVTGYVAATGMSYVCPDTTQDPLYLEGAAGSRSSLTVPLIFHGTVIGTLNVESPQPDTFDDRDRQFIEIYGRNIAAALNTLELLEAEKVSTASASVEAINRELAIPLDDIITDATTVLDRYAGHDEDIIARLRHLLYRAREIRSLIHKAGSAIAPPAKQGPPATAPRLAGTRILVVDADESIRRSAHHLLGSQGGQRRDRPRRPRGHRADAAGPLLDGPGRHPAARPRRLRDLQAAARGPAERADHPDDGVRLGPVALDRQGAAGGPADGALQAVPGRSPDGGRRAGRCAPRRQRGCTTGPASAPHDGHANRGATPPGRPLAGRPTGRRRLPPAVGRRIPDPSRPRIMSLDWPWTAFVLLAAVPAGLGHLCHLILAVNIASGLGHREPVLDRVRLVLFSAFWVSSAMLLWGHLHAPWWTWSWPLRGYAALCMASGLVIWPVSTLILALRRHPEGISRDAAVRVIELAEPERA